MAKQTKPQPDNQRVLIYWLMGFAILVLGLGLWLWLQYLHRSPYRVFWDMVDNNLTISSVNRTVSQEEQSGKVTQDLQLFLGANNYALGKTTIQQTAEDGRETSVVTETIGTPKENLARYTNIEIKSKGKQVTPNLEKVLNIWSKESLGGEDQLNQSVFAEAVFATIPFANLPQHQRQELVSFMKSNEVYKLNYDNAKKVTFDGKAAYEFEVEVNVSKYIELLQKLDKMMGLKQLENVDPKSYAQNPNIKLKVTSAIDSRQLLEVAYVDASRKEKFTAYGVHAQLALPQASISRTELEDRLQKALGTGQ